MDKHWFDDLNKAVVREAPRRTMLRAAAAVLLGLALGSPPAIMARPRGRPVNNAGKGKKGKHNGKGKGKQQGNGKRKNAAKPKPPPNPPPLPAASCSGGACAAEPIWAGDDTQIGFCETKCERCQEAGTAFCIHVPDDEHPNTHATCCPDGQDCCGGECCHPGGCCDSENGVVCLRSGETCCASDPSGFCFDDETCCPGIGCVEGTECRNDSCAQTCAGPGLQCCGGACVDTRFDNEHCGPLCQRCNAGLTCCDGFCVDLLWQEKHCGACGNACEPGQYCCYGSGQGCIDSCGGACQCADPL